MHPILPPQRPVGNGRNGDTESPALVTAAQAIRLIEQWDDLSDNRRRDLTSACRNAARIAGLPPDALIMEAGNLRDRVLRGTAAEFGMAEATLRNLRAMLRFILARLGAIEPPLPALEPAWVLLLARVGERPRAGLIRFGRFCSTRRITPAEVTPDTMQDFNVYLRTRVLCANPAKIAGATRTLWNRCCKADPAWPARPLPRPASAGQYVLPLSDFPPSFADDLAAFGRRSAAEPFSEEFDLGQPAIGANGIMPGRRRALRPASIITRTDHIRWAAAALAATGVSTETIRSLGDLVAPVEHARDIMRFFWVRAGNSPSPTGHHVGEALRIIATYHAPVGPADLARIRQWASAMNYAYRGMTIKNADAIRAALTPWHDAKLLALPDALMIIARGVRQDDPRKAASLAMRAVGIDFLLRVPIRLANMIGIRLNEHIQSSTPGSRIMDRLVIRPHEEKTEQTRLLPIPKTTGRLIAEWCRDFRPAVAAAASAHLFPGGKSGLVGITPQGFRAAIATTTHRMAGVRLTPHQFRHLAAARYLAEFPGQYEVVRQLLGHSSLVTTTRHYAGIEAETAARRFDQVVLGHQKAGAKLFRRPKRKPQPEKTPEDKP